MELATASGLPANQCLQSFQQRFAVLRPNRDGVRYLGGNLHALGKFSQVLALLAAYMLIRKGKYDRITINQQSRRPGHFRQVFRHVRKGAQVDAETLGIVIEEVLFVGMKPVRPKSTA